MRRTCIYSMVLALLLVAFAVPAFPATKSRAVSSNTAVVKSAAQQLAKIYTADQLAQGVYVGSNFCLACHTTKSTYRDTLHAAFVRRPLPQYSLIPGKGVINDYDKNGVDDFAQGLDFNNISSVFDKYKPNAPKLSM
ncbi:MAG TPA: hypothetical protein VHU41_19375, partial [Thermoanaerobaculia bacterium]|nr:hypothetical protein [Thermoanaerobaculia bacterium]